MKKWSRPAGLALLHQQRANTGRQTDSLKSESLLPTMNRMLPIHHYLPTPGFRVWGPSSEVVQLVVLLLCLGNALLRGRGRRRRRRRGRRRRRLR